jgi:CarboxypepD_reg-like domain
MATSNFNCSFSDLSDVARLGWFSYQLHLDRFSAHKPSKYTQALADENFALIKAFDLMDDYQAHTKPIQDARQLFINEVKGVANTFKRLKSYANELTADEEVRKVLFKDAGQQLFEKLRVNHLEDNDGLLDAMIRFVQKEQAALLVKDLPTDFLAQLQLRRVSLDDSNKAWLAEDAAGSAASLAKTLAGNTIKANLSAMFLEAQTFFVEEKEIAKKFVWDTLLAQVRGARDAGIGGKIILKGTKKAAAGVTVSIPVLNISVVSDADGRYQLSPLPVGTYDIDVTGVGFQKQVIEGRSIKQGTIGRLNIEVEVLV